VPSSPSGEEPEARHGFGGKMQTVLEEEGDGNVHQPKVRLAEADQHQKRGEIEKDQRPRRAARGLAMAHLLDRTLSLNS